jgi:hypothetical protein
MNIKYLFLATKGYMYHFWEDTGAGRGIHWFWPGTDRAIVTMQDCETITGGKENENSQVSTDDRKQ